MAVSLRARRFGSSIAGSGGACATVLAANPSPIAVAVAIATSMLEFNALLSRHGVLCAFWKAQEELIAVPSEVRNCC